MLSTISSDQFVQKYPAQTAKSVQMYPHSMRIPHLDIEQGCNCPHKKLSQRGIPLLFSQEGVIWQTTRNVRIFVMYWHKMCFALTFS
jgi:hypothetical protein